MEIFITTRTLSIIYIEGTWHRHHPIALVLQVGWTYQRISNNTAGNAKKNALILDYALWKKEKGELSDRSIAY